MQKLIQKSQNGLCIYKIRTKILSTENPPRPAAPPFSRQGRSVCFSVYGFFTILLSHSFVRFLHELCVCDIGSCFVCDKWHRMRLYEKCAKSQRHLWTGCTSSCHPELDSGSINAKKFQNFFIIFAKKCNFFTIIKLYNLFFRRKTYARFTKQNSP